MTGPTHDPFFFTDASLIESQLVRLEDGDARHLKKVRRAKPGDLIRVSDGRGRVLSVKLTTLTEGRAEGEIIEERVIDRPSPFFGVLQGLAKGAKVDFAIQKLVEVGVDQIAVFMAGRSVPGWDEQRRAKALSRWQTIAREAAKQSRRAWLPKVSGPIDLTDALAIAEEYELKLVLDAEAEETLRRVLPKDVPKSVVGIVGPEGGLSDEELSAFLKSSAHGVRLGSNILRTETAALVLMGALMYHFGRF